MANGTYRLLKQDASGNWNEVDFLAENGKVLGFDSSLNPEMVYNGIFGLSFYTFYNAGDVTSGNLAGFNEEQRFYYIYNTNYSASVIPVSLSRNKSSGGQFPSINLEHYILIKNNAASTKTVTIQGAVSGSKIIMADSSGISLDAGKLLEIGYFWTIRGSDYVCIITRSNILTETTT